MIFQTEIKIRPLEQTIRYGDGLLYLGSCFADEVGGICKGLGFNAMVNPFGVLYNPASIAQSVERLHSGKPFIAEEVIKVGEGQYCTFSHNTTFWNVSETALLEQVNGNLKAAHEHFMEARWGLLGCFGIRKPIRWSPIATSCLPDNLTGSFSPWSSRRTASQKCCKPIPTSDSSSPCRPCVI